GGRSSSAGSSRSRRSAGTSAPSARYGKSSWAVDLPPVFPAMDIADPRFSWPTAGASSGQQPPLAALRAFILDVCRDLDPESRYIRELLAVLDASSDVADYRTRLKDASRTTLFRTDGSRVSRGERGYSWLDDETWDTMDIFECTLANLITGET